MTLANTSTRYGDVAKGLHWLTALMILTLIPLGLVANAMAWDTPEALAAKARLFSLHKTLGVALFFVALARIGWALSQTKPGPMHPDRRGEVFLASAVHWALYGALVVVPLSGWVHHAASQGFAPILWPFGQGLPVVPKSETVAGGAAAVHWLGGRVLMAALALHVAGAMKHHFWDRDATLKRMWFGGTQAGAPAREGRGPFLAAAAIWATVLISGIGLAPPPETPDGPALAPVETGWQVENGTLTIRITQFEQEVRGVFAEWTAAIEFDPDSGTGSVDVVVSIPSLTLGSVTKEAMAPAYFDADTYPEARYMARIAPNGDGYVATGTLTLKGREEPVALPFKLDIADGTAVMSASLQLDRSDFGIGDPADKTLGAGVTVEVELTARL